MLQCKSDRVLFKHIYHNWKVRFYIFGKSLAIPYLFLIKPAWSDASLDIFFKLLMFFFFIRKSWYLLVKMFDMSDDEFDFEDFNNFRIGSAFEIFVLQDHSSKLKFFFLF